VRARQRGDDGSPATELARLRLASGLGDAGLDDLPPRARRAVEVASRAGGDVTVSLDAAGAAEADARQARRAIDVACAQTRTVAVGLVAAPPLLVPALGRLLGADLVGFYGQPLGWAVGAVVLLLLAAGAGGVWALLARARRSLQAPAGGGGALPVLLAVVATGWLLAWWLAPLAGWLVARRRPTTPPPEQADEVADLIATSLSAGGAPAQAVRDVAAVRSDLAVPLARLAFDLDRGQPGPALPPPLEQVALLLHTASEAGAPAGDALRRLATDLRADDLARALAAAERLPAQLTFPTALALLPAVLLAVGAPIVHAGLAAAGGA
jgi:hypothetical protein